MILRVNGGYLDINEEPEIEKRVKIFESLDETLGDFSYSFSGPKTQNNFNLLGIPTADTTNKVIYRQVPCEALDDEGDILYTGFIRVQNVSNSSDNIDFSFFAGNYNWISKLDGAITDGIDFSDYDTSLTASAILTAMSNSNGIDFPVVDAGGLITRSYRTLMREDFNAVIYVKDIFSRIMRYAGLKVKGDLINNADFNNAVVCVNNRSQDDIDDRSTYAAKDPDQSIVRAAAGTTIARITFEDDTTSPYFDGSQDNFTSSTYLADIGMKIDVDITLIYSQAVPTNTIVIKLYKNGAPMSPVRQKVLDSTAVNQVENIQFTGIQLAAGDYLDVYADFTTIPGGGTLTIHTGSTVRYTPTYLYKVFGNNCVPRWSKKQFIDNVLKPFCAITDYDPKTGTLTIDLFENIKNKEPIDLSDQLVIDDENFEEFISNFAQRNTLSYEESDVEEIKQYNVANYAAYGEGEILIDNDFIDLEGELLKSDFKAPVSYVNNTFGASLERMNFVTLSEGQSQEFTSVTDVGGGGVGATARVNLPDDTIYSVEMLVRITNSSNPEYNGDWVVDATGVGTGFITLSGLLFDTDATGTVTILTHKLTTDDSVFLLIIVPYVDIDTFSMYENFELTTTSGSGIMSYAFFNLLNTGRAINSSYPDGLSFGDVNSPLSFQRNLIQRYWGVVTRTLNDPMKLFCTGHIRKDTFLNLTPLRPIVLRTEKTNNYYYLNNITGYKKSSQPCQVELVKLG